jgi:hypothetical protein
MHNGCVDHIHIGLTLNEGEIKELVLVVASGENARRTHKM